MPYTLIEEIGHGGMGCVYKGMDQNGRKVAIKMMSNRVTCYPEYRQLFQSEVDTLKRMDHPAVVHIVGEPYRDDKGNLYLPMEYIEGQTIEQKVNSEGTIPMEEAVSLMCKILEALQYVHDRNRIHRDIKPSNIMIRPNGSICIIDFGIAKDARVGSGNTVGHIIGTDGYMSPEQANGLNIDRRTDIYSLGCVLYYLLTGKHAISKGKNDYETICNILQNIPSLPSQSGTGVSTALDDVFAKAVDKNMTLRYQTASEFKDAIEQAIGKASPSVTIGRLESNNIVIKHDDVSRRHLIIRGAERPMTGGAKQYQLEIVDVGSKNGTGINGRLLRNDTYSINYDGTVNLPEVLLAGKPELAINWPNVMSILRSKGWNPQVYDRPKPPKPPVPRESLHWFLCIVSLIPPLGWILWGVYKDEHPQKASLAAKFGWIGFVISLIGFIISVQ